MKETGLTLIEVVISAALLALVAGASLPFVTDALSSLRRPVDGGSIEELSLAADEYAARCAREGGMEGVSEEYCWFVLEKGGRFTARRVRGAGHEVAGNPSGQDRATPVIEVRP